MIFIKGSHAQGHVFGHLVLTKLALNVLVSGAGPHMWRTVKMRDSTSNLDNFIIGVYHRISPISSKKAGINLSLFEGSMYSR